MQCGFAVKERHRSHLNAKGKVRVYSQEAECVGQAGDGWKITERKHLG